MYKFLRIVVLLLLSVVVACSDENNSSSTAANNTSLIRVYTSDGNILKKDFNVEIADTNEKIYHGLMGRTSLDINSGMLFDITLVPKDMDIAFWMKDTPISLDVLFIDEKGSIYFIHENAQPYDTTPIYPPKRPRAVLEINGGQVQKLGIKVGDMLKADLLGNN